MENKKTQSDCLAVKRSSAGLGLFARCAIKKGQFVAEYKGEIISSSEAEERGGKYLFDISTRRVIDGSARSNIARYINHSCAPNCEAEIDGSRVMIYAIKNIKEGEELTYNYGKEYFDDIIKPVGCRCLKCGRGKGGRNMRNQKN